MGFQLRVVRGGLRVVRSDSNGRIQLLFRHGVIAACMPRMAFGQPHRAHRAATQNTINAYGVSSVFGATREEAAALTQHWTNAVLIRFDEAESGDFSSMAPVSLHGVTEGAGRDGCAEAEAVAAHFAM